MKYINFAECDLTETAIQKACDLFKLTPDELRIYTGLAGAVNAYAIREKYGCVVTILPDEIIEAPDCWAIHGYNPYNASVGDVMLWSRGALPRTPRAEAA